MLISEDYRRLNEQLHAMHKHYGASGHRWAPDVLRIASAIQAIAILDYGAGRGTLARALERMCGPRVVEYDPAVPGIRTLPKSKFPMVVCTDVLEHVEPECLDDVLDAIRAHTEELVYLVVCCRWARKTLPDGRNAHLIVESPMWWEKRIGQRFHIICQRKADSGNHLFVGEPR